MGVKVGIDLGTTFSAVAWVNPATGKPEVIRSDVKSSSLITPSAIQFLPGGRIVCGAEAKEAFEMAEEGVATGFKRHMGTNTICCYAPGGKEYNAEQLSAIMLRHLKENAERTLGQKIDEAVITVPAYFEDGPRSATRRAARQAGLNVTDIISEPTAAALHYGLGNWRQNALILVYDLGGGTFDVTLVGMADGYNLRSVGTIGEHQRGGRDWDARLADLIIEKFEAETGVQVREDIEFVNDVMGEAEAFKQTLSMRTVVKVKRNIEGYGAVEIQVTRDEFESRTRDLLEMTGDLCDKLLEDVKVRWSQITDVLLVGGSTRMPQVTQYLTKKAGKAPIGHVNPDQAVAIGAAMRANMHVEEEVVDLGRARNHQEELLSSLRGPVGQAKAVELSAIRFQDTVAHAMGIILLNQDRTAYINETIIPANSPVPCKYAVSTRFNTNVPEMEIYVVQGSGSIAECTVNAKYVVSGFKKVKGGWSIMRVQYSYDRNHLIHVQVRQDQDNFDLPIRKEPFTQEDIDRFLRPYDPSSDVVAAPLTIVLAVDVSGSMSGAPLRNAKKAMSDFARSYEEVGAKIGVIAVSDRVKWVSKPTDDYRKCQHAIESITECMTGVCNAADPFREIDEELTNMEGERFAIILADGVWEHQPTAVQRAKVCHSHDVKIAAIGFGSADKKFLRDISSHDDLALMTTHTNLGSSFGKIAQSIGSGASAGSGMGGGTIGSGAKKGLFGKKKAEDDGVVETWEIISE